MITQMSARVEASTSPPRASPPRRHAPGASVSPQRCRTSTGVSTPWSELRRSRGGATPASGAAPGAPPGGTSGRGEPRAGLSPTRPRCSKPAATPPRTPASCCRSRLVDMQAQLRSISLEYGPAELAMATQNWHPSQRLGTGSYGAVYRGELKDGSEVAVKAIDLSELTDKPEGLKDGGFEEEVLLLSKFRHPNLVTLLGWGQGGVHRYLVYEFLAGGDVFQRLRKSRLPSDGKTPGAGVPFPWAQRLSVCLDSATGLSHMHNSTPKAFHRDIKSANVLLDRHGVAKMADFGLSCISAQAGASHVTTKTVCGTPGYTCPVYQRTGRCTEGSEVHAFGMFVLEVLTGLSPSMRDSRRPSGLKYPVSEAIRPDESGAVERCVDCLEGAARWPRSLAQELGSLALRCICGHSDQQRPRFVEVVRAVRQMVERDAMEWADEESEPSRGEDYPQAAMAGYGVTGIHHGGHAAIPVTEGVLMPGAADQAGDRTVPAWADDVGDGNVVKVKPAEMPFFLEVIVANGVPAASLPPEFVRMPLSPSSKSGEDGEESESWATCFVGRLHQPRFFQSWLPAQGQRILISRTAFKLSWTRGADHATLLACGTNTLAVDNKVARKGATMVLRPGSDLRFSYERKLLLHLRFSTWTTLSTAPLELPLILSDDDLSMESHEQGMENPAMELQQSSRQVLMLPATRRSHSPSTVAATPARKSDVCANLFQTVEEPGGQHGEVLFDDGPEIMSTWCLECVHSECLPKDGLRSMSPELRRIGICHGMTVVGWGHQAPSFEAWLPDPVLRYSISRTHFRLEVADGCLSLTNMSFSTLCIDGQPLEKGKVSPLGLGQTVSFIRQEGVEVVHFLKLQVQESQAFSAASSPRLEHTLQHSWKPGYKEVVKSVEEPALFLEVLTADGQDVKRLSPALRRLALSESPSSSGQAVVYVGRQHQPKHFDAWFPCQSLSALASQTSFEVSWLRGSSGPVTFRRTGATSISIDGRLAVRGVSTPLVEGAEISVLLDRKVVLCLCFSLARPCSPTRKSKPYEQFASAGSGSTDVPSSTNGDSAPASATTERSRTLRPYHRSSRGQEYIQDCGYGGQLHFMGNDDLEGCSFAGPEDLMQREPTHQQAGSWRLCCLRSEELSADAVAMLRPDLCEFLVPRGELLIGWGHQPRHFEAWLPDPILRYSSARTQLRLEAVGDSVVVTNLGLCDLTVAGKLLARGEPQHVMEGQVMSFTRRDAGSHVPFLELQLRCA